MQKTNDGRTKTPHDTPTTTQQQPQGSAVLALRSKPGFGGQKVTPETPQVSLKTQEEASVAPNRSMSGTSLQRMQARPRQQPQNREALRQSAPPWGILLDHRHNGKLLNVSRTGLAVEVRQAPCFETACSLKVSWDRGEAVDLDVAVVWCRMVGVEEVGEGDLMPRFMVGLQCADARLVELGAPRAV